MFWVLGIEETKRNGAYIPVRENWQTNEQSDFSREQYYEDSILGRVKRQTVETAENELFG